MFGIGSKFLKYFALMKENLQEEIGEKCTIYLPPMIS